MGVHRVLSHPEHLGCLQETVSTLNDAGLVWAGLAIAVFKKALGIFRSCSSDGKRN